MIAGIGINDADYTVTTKVDGKQKVCPIYLLWKSMINRCYAPATLAVDYTYKGCSVVEEWLTFSNFKAWMEQQDWQDKGLDKDLLVPDNKVYGPNTCVFVPKDVNSFMTENKISKGTLPVGVHAHKNNGFVAQCNDLGKGSRYIGFFETVEAASLAYQKRKREVAVKLANLQTDQRVADALLKRYPEV